ncbi:MAG: hypothetical protein KC468_36805, partial [Myxococcales bacterium]|nr:hypothetical protein [Myxococcales bacterium]
GDEVCDGDALAGASCDSLGLGGGALACAGDCASYDVSGCEFSGFFESFESGDLIENPWVSEGAASWTVEATLAHDGDFVARSGPIDGDEWSELAITLEFPVAGQITFWHRESSEFCCDKLRFYVDDEQLGEWSGLTEWTESSFDVGAGEHVLAWRYEKDMNVEIGDDFVIIDAISADGVAP